MHVGGRHRRSPTASSPSTPTRGVAARRGGAVACCDLNRLFLPRGWFTPVTPGHPVRHAGRHGRGRRARQEPPRRRLLRRARAAAAHARGRRPHRRVLRRAASASSSAPPSAAWGSPATSSRSSSRWSASPSPWIWQESERVPNIDAALDAPGGGGRELAVHRGLDRLPRARRRAGPRHPDARAAGPSRTRRRRAPPRGASAPALPFVAAELAAAAAGCVRAFNALPTTAKHGAGARRRHRAPGDVLLPARRRARTGTACTAGAASRSTSACCPRPRGQRGPALPRTAARARRRVFLCVIKDCGRGGPGPAVAFRSRASRSRSTSRSRDDTQALVDALNELVIAEGGRIYLAKDAFTRAEHFRAMEPRLDELRRACAGQWDPQRPLEQRAVGAPARGSAREGGACSARRKGMGRALARLMAERGDALFLLGATRDELATQRADLQSRGAAGTVGVAALRPARTGAPSRRRSTPPSAGSAGSTRWSSPPGCSRRRSGSSRTPSCAHRLLHRQLRQHGRVLRAGAPAPARARRRHAVRVQLGGRRARPQAGGALRRRQGRALRATSRARSQVPRAGPADDAASSPAS